MKQVYICVLFRSPMVYLIFIKFYIYRKPDLRRCTGCLVVYYCGRSCQKSGWNEHKGECQNLVKVRPNIPSDSVRLIARIILKLQVFKVTFSFIIF